jgi:hypothetical protein
MMLIRCIFAYLEFFYSSRAAPFIFWSVLLSTTLSICLLWYGSAIDSLFLLVVGACLALPLAVTYLPWLVVLYLFAMYMLIVTYAYWPLRDWWKKSSDSSTPL